MKLKILLIAFFSCTVLIQCTENKKESPTAIKKKLPNIVFIYTDDLGYGDVGFNGPSQIKTPNLNKLANNGLRFTNGYASSSTCTPSRYALLTGRYPWREKEAKILPGTAPLIIGTNQATIPKMLKEKGYHTGIVGKWHLGLGAGNVNWNEEITPGPNQVGFDESYIMAATQDRVPTVYIKNGHVVNIDPNDPIEIDYQNNFPGQPTGLDNPELLKMKWYDGHYNSIVNGIPRIGFMNGGEKAKWIDEDMADHFLQKAQDYVKKNKDKPFFLYYAMQQPHVPRTPHPRFVGKSGLGSRGDVILEADWCIGEFIKTLENENLLENTLIVFSSDNGPVLNDGYYDDAEEKLGSHNPFAQFRGGKYSLFDAGTHVPFFTYWKGTIKPAVSDALVCQIDLLSSLAKLVGSNTNVSDSKELLNTFLGKSAIGREHLVIEAMQYTAFRKNNWIMIPPNDGEAVNKMVKIELGNSTKYQLYDISNDIGQKTNLASVYPDKLKELIQEYKKAIK
ncbi:sulfatase family protein [Flavicella sediminum]|uniref:sulfatase family protein n=1 Tax=Flavicella sediminum TaxID=2585141 RepID=UPI00111D4088|nr:arylsulfatase [Flavicella sediminum]